MIFGDFVEMEIQSILTLLAYLIIVVNMSSKNLIFHPDRILFYLEYPFAINISLRCS